MSESDASPSQPWRSGVAAARANAGPGLILQGAALAALILYYRWEPAHEALVGLVRTRQKWGWAFPAFTTALFGGGLPYAYFLWQGWRDRQSPRYSPSQGWGIIAFWGYKGLEVNFLYLVLARFVGSGHGLGTIAAKAVADQIIYCPLFAVPVTVAMYELAEARFNWRSFLADWRSAGWYRRRVLPVLISNMSVWVPAVCIIYALPTPLQLPMQNLVLCFFTLMVAHQTRRTHQA